MSRNLKEADEDTTVEAAAHQMMEGGVSSLIIRPKGKEEPYGIITSKDVVNAVADGLDLSKVRVSEIASSPLVVVSPGVPANYVARLMRKADLRHIAVFNGLTVVGIISNIDIVRAAAKGMMTPQVELPA